MRRVRFSIRGLLAVVLFLGVALAALREATALWDSAVFSVALGLLVAAILLAVHRTGRKRAFWVGFVLAGGVYLGMSLIPPVESRLLTTKGLAYLDAKRQEARGLGVTYFDLDSDGKVDIYVAKSDGGVLYRSDGQVKYRDLAAVLASTSRGAAATSGSTRLRSWKSWAVRPGPGGTSENFRRIGHSVLAVALAMAGGWGSRAMRRDNGE
jgi:hypothetical protein